MPKARFGAAQQAICRLSEQWVINLENLSDLDYSPDRSSHFMIRRTPKNFDGIISPTKKIGDLLPEMLAEIGKRGVGEKEAIFLFWETLLGEKMAPLAQCVSWADGILTVKVKSATLYSLLCQHEKPRLLKRLQEKFPIRNIVFRVG